MELDQGREIIVSLKETLEHYRGLGLAAPLHAGVVLHEYDHLDGKIFLQ